ncbi:SHOCT domain-containing protein [Chitinivibrio alkaliphilus]|uniref:SHOCT domain-containing protein n=1 Tax=Chitinivibrio alkaliphilus ACht1 TaxID=1313304 RepID=U7DC90_9BACT|nr:SHOCT domain-containing protein [Chitinivibrio alkaliphilus]ERP39193.1 hypothetical protein CALK_0363 [Chitinivibrio alkaliphilus ACht1]
MKQGRISFCLIRKTASFLLGSALIGGIIRRCRHHSCLCKNGNVNQEHGESAGVQSPLELLKKRYVLGEISRKEFEQMRRDISE